MKKILSVIVILLISTAGFATKRSNLWHELRDAHLKKQPVCQICGTSKDLQVHHIVPFNFRRSMELDPDNLVTLCVSKYWGMNCHMEIGHGGNWRLENPWIEYDIKQIKIYGDPSYIKYNGSAELESYMKMIRASVKEFMALRKEENNEKELNRLSSPYYLKRNGTEDYDALISKLKSQCKSDTRDPIEEVVEEE